MGGTSPLKTVDSSGPVHGSGGVGGTLPLKTIDSRGPVLGGGGMSGVHDQGLIQHLQAAPQLMATQPR